jgi:hypothetical protein
VRSLAARSYRALRFGLDAAPDEVRELRECVHRLRQQVHRLRREQNLRLDDLGRWLDSLRRRVDALSAGPHEDGGAISCDLTAPS